MLRAEREVYDYLAGDGNVVDSGRFERPISGRRERSVGQSPINRIPVIDYLSIVYRTGFRYGHLHTYRNRLTELLMVGHLDDRLRLIHRNRFHRFRRFPQAAHQRYFPEQAS
jgi:hypothetical protein